MPDVNDFRTFDGLRNALAPAVPPPDFADVERRAARSPGRSIAVVAAGVVTLLLLGAVMYALRGVDRGPGPVQAATPLATAGAGWQIHNLTVLDRDHIYAVAAKCHHTPSWPASGTSAKTPACEYRASTGERTRGSWKWQATDLPESLRSSDIPAFPGFFLAVGKTLIVRQSLLVNVPSVPASRQPALSTEDYLVSTDRGRSWKPWSDDAPVAAAVGGAVFDPRLDPRVSDAQLGLLGADSSGRVGPLVQQPPLKLHRVENRPDAIWAAGLDPATGRPAVSVSRNGGASWQTHVFSEVAANSGAGVFVAPGEDAVYVMLKFGTKVGDPSAATVLRSDDGGSTWKQISSVELGVYYPKGPYVRDDGKVEVYRNPQDSPGGSLPYTYERRVSSDRGVTWQKQSGPVFQVPAGWRDEWSREVILSPLANGGFYQTTAKGVIFSDDGSTLAELVAPMFAKS